MIDLKDLGFNMTSKDFGTIKPESYSVKPDHFTPTFRTVYVADCDWRGGFCYVTSSITGTYRGYRCRNSYDTEVGNIFASGKTRAEALAKFAENFANKKYNRAGN